MLHISSFRPNQSLLGIRVCVVDDSKKVLHVSLLRNWSSLQSAGWCAFSVLFTFTALYLCTVISLAMTVLNNQSWLFCIFCNKLLSNWSGWFITSHWVIICPQATVSYWTSEVGGGGGKAQMLVYQFEIVPVFSARESEPTVSFMKHKNFVSIVSATKYDE